MAKTPLHHDRGGRAFPLPDGGSVGRQEGLRGALGLKFGYGGTIPVTLARRLIPAPVP